MPLLMALPSLAGGSRAQYSGIVRFMRRLLPGCPHHVVTAPLTHYSLTKLYEQVTHTAYLGHARTAPSLARAFELPLR
jgi:hypothetical protein